MTVWRSPQRSQLVAASATVLTEPTRKMDLMSSAEDPHHPLLLDRRRRRPLRMRRVALCPRPRSDLGRHRRRWGLRVAPVHRVLGRRRRMRDCSDCGTQLKRLQTSCGTVRLTALSPGRHRKQPLSRAHLRRNVIPVVVVIDRLAAPVSGVEVVVEAAAVAVVAAAALGRRPLQRGRTLQLASLRSASCSCALCRAWKTLGC